MTDLRRQVFAASATSGGSAESVDSVDGPNPPRRNVELKAKNPDPERSLAVCRALGARERGLIFQRDTYFNVSRGGLKLREESPGGPHLIQFRRASEAQQRPSSYRIVPIEDGASLRTALSDALGERGVVVKRRHLFLWRHVRIHLDEVEGLGSFLELEAVAPAYSDLTYEYELVAELRDVLGITDELLCADGYADQLLSPSPVQGGADSLSRPLTTRLDNEFDEPGEPHLRP